MDCELCTSASPLEDSTASLLLVSCIHGCSGQRCTETFLLRLQGLYTGCGARELARIIFHTTRHRITGQTARRLWERLPPVAPPSRPLLDYHSHPERVQARQAVIALYAQGWSKRSISQFLHVSRPTINLWLTRFARDNTASLADKSSAPHTPARKVWLPVLLEIYHRQKRHPDAGGFRIWSLRGKTDLSVRTVERIMALNRQVSTDIPGTEALHTPPAPPRPHPCKATMAHEYWFIDGRMMDFALAACRREQAMAHYKALRLVRSRPFA